MSAQSLQQAAGTTNNDQKKSGKTRSISVGHFDHENLSGVYKGVYSGITMPFTLQAYTAEERNLFPGDRKPSHRIVAAHNHDYELGFATPPKEGSQSWSLSFKVADEPRLYANSVPSNGKMLADPDAFRK